MYESFESGSPDIRLWFKLDPGEVESPLYIYTYSNIIKLSSSIPIDRRREQWINHVHNYKYTAMVPIETVWPRNAKSKNVR